MNFQKTDFPYMKDLSNNDKMIDKKLLKDELNELLELQEEIYFRDSKFEEDSYCEDLFENNENIVCLIVAEFEVFDIKKTHIHYDYNHMGSDKFHKILDKYNLMFEWQDSCIGIICMKSIE